MISSPIPALFPHSYIPNILQDVIDACKLLESPSAEEKRPEEALTAEIYRDLVRRPNYRVGPIEPHYESWLPDLDSRADIRFTCGMGVETYFLVEAKRLHVIFPSGKTASLASEYIEKGVKRFVSKKYAPYQISSAMLGYVFNKSIDEAIDSIENAINASATELNLLKLHNGSSCGKIPCDLESEHQLDQLFRLYHLFVKIPPC